ncbi:uncharacterized protein F4822DRAFT_389595 [Hypoxylon trugodes]|uniref:uncharacterized protein n=1 Tax=Hypoxylon trugodes TaxID=326681 RepID=UPI00219EFCE5|nr:uncharacterized protein F4822DRAFT_389595 [Hypoxylon trugodes]KAI1392087.1 hypothetical protein F4822DRAFT_389595 [Hypoxylon trugodes]
MNIYRPSFKKSSSLKNTLLLYSVITSKHSKHTSFVSQILSHHNRSILVYNSTFHSRAHNISLKQQHYYSTMSSKLIPSNPSDVAVIRHITPNIVTVSVPFARFGLIRVGGRGTIIRLTSGTLAVFSPVALTPETQAKVSELGGNVGYIIAGDIEHHIFLSEWSRAYPQAKILGPKGLQEKRAKTHDDPKIGDEPFAFIWDASNKREVRAVSDEFAADFEVEFVDAHPNQEVVLLYKPDKVLIQADLLFNLPAVEQYSRVPEAEKNAHGFVNRIFESINSTAGEAKGLKRFLWYVLSNANKNRAGFNESVKRIESWDFETIIPCHGETIEGNGKELFRKVFEWHLQGHK